MERLVAGFTWLLHLWTCKTIHALLGIQLHGQLGVSQPWGTRWSLWKTLVGTSKASLGWSQCWLSCDLSRVGMEERQHQVAETVTTLLAVRAENLSAAPRDLLRSTPTRTAPGGCCLLQPVKNGSEIDLWWPRLSAAVCIVSWHRVVFAEGTDSCVFPSLERII